MSKKVTTEYTCDDCGKKSPVEMQQVSHHGTLTSTEQHICELCISHRVAHSFSVAPLGSCKCPECKGSGRVKEPYGVHNDYNLVDCKPCKGKGRASLV